MRVILWKWIPQNPSQRPPGLHMNPVPFHLHHLQLSCCPLAIHLPHVHPTPPLCHHHVLRQYQCSGCRILAATRDTHPLLAAQVSLPFQISRWTTLGHERPQFLWPHPLLIPLTPIPSRRRGYCLVYRPRAAALSRGGFLSCAILLLSCRCYKLWSYTTISDIGYHRDGGRKRCHTLSS